MESFPNSTPAVAPAMIPSSSAYIDRLHSLLASEATQKKAGFTTKMLTARELEQKKRCINCGDRAFRATRAPKPRVPHQKPASQAAAPPQQTASSSVTPGSASEPPTAVIEQPQQPHCKFHLGKVTLKHWTCCGRHVSEPPCGGSDEHLLPHDPDDRKHLKRWQFHNTPAHTRPGHRAAVSIDCEMGTAKDGEPELIRLTLVDYFSGATLVDTLVYPSVPMQHFNTKWSGVTRAQMEKARKGRQCLFGLAAARAAVFEHVGPATVVVGHCLLNDLKCLRWLHSRIVDSFLIESGLREAARREAEEERNMGGIEVPPTPPKSEEAERGSGGRRGNPDGMSLKALALKKLGRSIQMGKGHDSLEDAIAARDLVHSFVVGMSVPSVA